MPDFDPDDPEYACHDDGPLLRADDEAVPDEDLELYPLFAEALDPNSPKTVEEAEAEWAELLR